MDKLQNTNILDLDKEIIVVNDASKDNTKKIIHDLMKKYPNIKYLEHSQNKGKGAAIRTAQSQVMGDYVTIQDGDLEYNPQDFNELIKPIINGKTNVVYGSRMKGKITGFQIPSHYYGNLFLSSVTRILYGQKITDMETCYKMMKADTFKELNLKSNRFDIEPEITAKLAKKNHKIMEIPINYISRSFSEGKKIHWNDGLSAIIALLKYRFFN
jgi:glycosyltransferase involved in cell wall biosynthesis